jgi:hypothetical protein
MTKEKFEPAKVIGTVDLKKDGKENAIDRFSDQGKSTLQGAVLSRTLPWRGRGPPQRKPRRNRHIGHK